MIYDQMKYLDSYRGISGNLDRAIDYLAGNDVSSLPEGRYPVDGDRIVLLVQSYETKEISRGKYEAHKKYMDIQFLLEGKEAFYVTPLEPLKPLDSFNLEKDIGFYTEPDGGEVLLPLLPGTFVLVFPQDAHKPGCVLDEKGQVKKIVVKVAV